MSEHCAQLVSHLVLSSRIVIVIVLLSFASVVSANEATSSELRKQLLNGYDPQVRPVKDPNHNTTVQFAISIKSFDLDDAKQKISVVSWIFTVWADEYLVWEPKENNNLETLNFDKNELWTPDVALFNSADGASVFPNSKLPAIVDHSGMVVLGAPFVAVVPCLIDLYKWPTDEHNCTLSFGSWAHHGDQIDLELGRWFNRTIMLDAYEENTKWKLVNQSVSKQTTNIGKESYVHIDFNITVKRNGSGHAVYISHSTAAVIILVLSSYVLPLNFHLSRILLHLFGMGVLVACDLVLFMNMPTTEGRVPHIVRYYSGAIVLTTMSLISTILVTLSLSGPFAPNMGLRSKLAKMWNKSSTVEVSGEVAYRTLEDAPESELAAEMPNSTATTIQVDDTPREGSTGVRMRKPQTYAVQSFYGSTTIHRVINAVLFSLFCLAYVIDFIVLHATIY